MGGGATFYSLGGSGGGGVGKVREASLWRFLLAILGAALVSYVAGRIVDDADVCNAHLSGKMEGWIRVEKAFIYGSFMLFRIVPSLVVDRSMVPRTWYHILAAPAGAAVFFMLSSRDSLQTSVTGSSITEQWEWQSWVVYTSIAFFILVGVPLIKVYYYKNSWVHAVLWRFFLPVCTILCLNIVLLQPDMGTVHVHHAGIAWLVALQCPLQDGSNPLWWVCFPALGIFVQGSVCFGWHSLLFSLFSE